MLRLCGADLRRGARGALRDPNNYVKVSGRLAEELARTEPNGAIWANQFDNVANREGHYRTTGPEIWRQTEGRIDAFTCAIGTGGTLAGVRPVPQGAQSGHHDRLRRPDGCGTLPLVQARRAQGRGQLDHRGHRPGPRLPPTSRARRSTMPCRSRTARRCPHLRTCGRGGPGARRIDGHQHRGCRSRRAHAGPGPHHRHHPRRLRQSLPKQALQPGVPAREGSAGAAMAGMRRRR